MTRQNTPTPEMPQAVRMAAPLGTMRRLVAGQGEHAAADDERDDGGDQTKKPQAAVHVGDVPL